ncbi:putative outer membrane starch-binding protein [Chitinophaga skermanii]|uniref:Putative outer membrane starch-binding protein n=1 Tax=Chitinophaga skermanii TaxID=331697 RepID=A0A327QU90_9BACT|nr:putative outer membrane starch-binding protein [Chitinophaga skermanii]
MALCLAGYLMLTSSCNKYLEVTPVSSFDPSFVFDNVPNATKAVLGAYADLTGDQAYGIRVSMYYPYDNDEMMGQGGTPYPDNERRDIAHYRANANNTQLAAPFAQLYNGIERANMCIYYIPKMNLYTNGTENDKKELRRLHGEALTLRAQYYLELLRNWGDLPAHFEPAFLETDLYKNKTDRDTIYNRLIADLAVAADLLPWRTQTSTKDERITQGAARALRARIALYRGGYALRKSRQMERKADYLTYYKIARDECEIIMNRRGDHNLNPSYQSVFKDFVCARRVDTYGEIIWEVGMAGGSSAAGDSKLGYYNGPRWGSTGNAALTVLPTYFYSFDSLDTRRDVMCAPYEFNTNGTFKARPLQQMVDGKFRRDWMSNPVSISSVAQYFGLNWPLIRFSDVLLMYAEAENELNSGPTANAIAAVKEVRKRAFGNNTDPVTVPTAYQDFFAFVVKERSLELGGEGHRKYDLIRWNLLATKLNETKQTLADMAAKKAPWNTYPANMYFKNNSTELIWSNSYYKPSTSAPSGYTSVAWIGTAINTTLVTYFAESFTPNKSELLPIPQSVLDANKILTQDYGHN